MEERQGVKGKIEVLLRSIKKDKLFSRVFICSSNFIEARSVI